MIAGAVLGSSSWSRIPRTTSPSVIMAISLRAPPQWGNAIRLQCDTTRSTATTAVLRGLPTADAVLRVVSRWSLMALSVQAGVA